VPRIEAVATVDLPAADAFALSQTYGEIRYRWDPFVKEQHLLDGATAAAKGVRTSTRSRHGFAMVSEYVSFKPPSQVGMRMVKGPWFFDSFSGGWHFAERDDGRTDATWRYTFACKPHWIRPVAHPIGRWLLGRDIRRRIEGYRTACADPSIVAAVRASRKAVTDPVPEADPSPS
jgi:hypothetical protein